MSEVSAGPLENPSKGFSEDLYDHSDLKRLETGLVPNPESSYKKVVTKRIPPIMMALKSVMLMKPYESEEDKSKPPPERVLFLFEPHSMIREGRQCYFFSSLIFCVKRFSEQTHSNVSPLLYVHRHKQDLPG
jgi:hypothetical protein